MIATGNEVRVGDIWECFRTKHNGWRICITKVLAQSVAFDVLRGPAHADRGRKWAGRGQHIQRGNLLANFYLIKSATPEPSTKEEYPMAIVAPSPTTTDWSTWKTCPACGEFLSFDKFEPLRGNAVRGHAGEVTKQCHACIVRKRGDGIRAAVARRKANQVQAIAPPPEPEPIPEPEPEPTPEPEPSARSNGHVAPQDTLAMRLLALAAEVDDWEHPPRYRKLFQAALAALTQGSEAHGVLIVGPVETIQLQEAVAQARLELDPIRRSS